MCDERIIWLDLAWDSWTEYELYYVRIRYDLKAFGDQLLVCVYKLGFYESTVVFELEKHTVSGSLLNMLREKPVKIALVQYTEA